MCVLFASATGLEGAEVGRHEAVLQGFSRHSTGWLMKALRYHPFRPSLLSLRDTRSLLLCLMCDICAFRGDSRARSLNSVLPP